MQRSQLSLLLALLLAFVLILKHENKPVVERIPEASFETTSTSPSSATRIEKIVKVLPRDEKAENQTLHKISEEVLATLVQTAQFKDLTAKEVHTVAPQVFKGALELKRFADMFEIERNASVPGSPEALAINQEASEFYKTCASSGHAAESIRAVCFIEYLKLAQKNNSKVELAVLNLPARVIRIAQTLAH